jgi:hypothetical protein
MCLVAERQASSTEERRTGQTSHGTNTVVKRQGSPMRNVSIPNQKLGTTLGRLDKDMVAPK